MELCIFHHRRKDSINDVISDALKGNAALIFDWENTAFTFDTKGYENAASQSRQAKMSLKELKIPC